MTPLTEEIYQSESSGYELNADKEFSISSDFTALQIISRNDMHIIYKGIRFGRFWVIKALTPEYREHDECKQMLFKEFDIMMRLSHDNIVAVHSLEKDPNLGLCIIMEYIDGTTLADWLKNSHDLSSRLKVALKLCEVFAYINDCGIVHRDIKPENILISRLNGSVKIIDFSHADTDNHILFKHPAGTEGFISPEQRSSILPDIRNDIYSFGKVLTWLLPDRRFKATRAKCLAKIDSRFSGFDQLEKKLKEDTRKPVIFFIVTFCITIAVFIVFAILFMTSRRPTPIESSILSGPDQTNPDTTLLTSQQIQGNQHEKDLSQTDVLLTSEDNNSEIYQKSQVNPSDNIIKNTGSKSGPNGVTVNSKEVEKIILAINAVWDKTAMHYLDTLTYNDNIYYDWSTYSMDKIRDDFLNSIRNSTSEEQLRGIKEKLDNQINTNYLKWQHKMKMIKEQN